MLKLRPGPEITKNISFSTNFSMKIFIFIKIRIQETEAFFLLRTANMSVALVANFKMPTCHLSWSQILKMSTWHLSWSQILKMSTWHLSWSQILKMPTCHLSWSQILKMSTWHFKVFEQDKSHGPVRCQSIKEVL